MKLSSLPKPSPFTDFGDVEAGRNPSYLNSVFLAFERGVFRAPTSLLALIGWPLATIIIAILYVTVGLALWVIARIFIICAGLAGMLRPKTVRPNQSALSDSAS